MVYFKHMKRRAGAQGYTLLEVMIVLAVSGGLLVAAMALISGQRQKTEFSQAIREIESQIQDVINDVATGYYANTGNFQCDRVVVGSVERPRLQTAASSAQGTNRDCVFIGRVMQFGVASSNSEQFNIYNVVGLRQALSGGSYGNSQTLTQARPTAMAPGTGVTANYPDSTEVKKLQYGLTINSIRVGNQDIGAIGFFGSLTPGGSSGGNLVSGAQTVELVPVPTTALNMTASSTVDAINRLDSSNPTINPSQGVVLCFQSGGTNEYGRITIGSNARRLTTTLQIGRGACT